MSMTGLEVFDETIHKTNTWLKEIGEVLGPDRHRSYQALRAVLHCLRDRLTVDEAAHLADQLPMLVRGIYYEAWHPAGKPDKIRSRNKFLTGITTRIAMKQSNRCRESGACGVRYLGKPYFSWRNSRRDQRPARGNPHAVAAAPRIQRGRVKPVK